MTQNSLKNMKDANLTSTSANHEASVITIPGANVMAVLPEDKQPVQEDRLVEVVAPADLPAAYQLHVDENGRTLVVVVPDGGVRQGDRFLALVLNEVKEIPISNPHNIPSGDWRDGLCECCTHGCCHPSLCMALWCQFCALGQVMTRNGLDWTGNPIGQRKSNTCSAFKVIFCIVLAYWILYSVFATIDAVYGSTAGDAIYIPFSILSWIYIIFLLLLTIRTRGYIRAKYAIQERYCAGCQDCCLGFWCTCCTVSQMARHTADYSKYPAGCCTENGLAGGAPDVV